MRGAIINRRRVLFAAAAGGFALSGLLPMDPEARAEGDDIDLADVPAKVKAAAAKAAPRATWRTDASIFKDDGKVTYELEGTDSLQRYVWVEVAAEGKVNELQTEIPFKEAPEVVRAALKAKAPRFKATTTYEVRQEGKVVRYDFEGKRPRDREEIGVYISVDGKDVEVDE